VHAWFVPLALVVIFVALSGYHTAVAMRALAPEVDGAFFKVLARGAFAGRQYFTERGWRHRNRALLYQGLSLVAGVVALLLS